MSKMNLEERMKINYEYPYRIYLSRRIPVIIRIDGKSFHNLTKNMDKPFSTRFRYCMEYTAFELLNNIQGCVLAYTQSDEISLLLFNYSKFNTQAWFDNNLQKVCSISASMATSMFLRKFIRNMKEYDDEQNICFDSRVFVIPEEEVNNYFIFRQQNCIRNSIYSIGQSSYSTNNLHNKSSKAIVEMIDNDNNISKKYDEYKFEEKYGSIFIKDSLVTQKLIFKEDGIEVIESLLKREEV